MIAVSYQPDNVLPYMIAPQLLGAMFNKYSEISYSRIPEYFFFSTKSYDVVQKKILFHISICIPAVNSKNATRINVF